MTETAKQSILEVADSTTGYEELEITSTFGQPLATLQLVDGSMWGRALLYVVKRRAGLVDVDAKAAVLGLSIKDVWESFADEAAESGKDEPESETQPESSPPSAS